MSNFVRFGFMPFLALVIIFVLIMLDRTSEIVIKKLVQNVYKTNYTRVRYNVSYH